MIVLVLEYDPTALLACCGSISDAKKLFPNALYDSSDKRGMCLNLITGKDEPLLGNAIRSPYIEVYEMNIKFPIL